MISAPFISRVIRILSLTPARALTQGGAFSLPRKLYGGITSSLVSLSTTGPSDFYGSASVILAKNVLSGCTLGLFKSRSKNLKSWSKRLVAPIVMKPYRFGRR